MFDNPFQAAVITIFILAGIAGVAVFAINPGLIGGGGDKQVSASAEIWGTVSEDDISAVLAGAGIPDDDTLTIDYTEVEPQNLRSRLVNQLAQDQGPDALLIPHTRLLQLDEFLVTFGSQTYNRRTFRSNFLQGAEIFTNEAGVKALPFAMDPLVMYWNRDMISAAGFVSPPETWREIPEYIKAITATDNTQNINQSAIALGTAENINESKAILSAMLLQAGNPIVTQQARVYEPALARNANNRDQAEAAVRLYTQFANPAAATYTWNNTFGSDRQSFVSNRLAMYFDTGQAIDEIRDQNPNLNFDVTAIPQREGEQPRTHATIYGLAMLDRVSPRRRANVFTALKRLADRPLSESLLANTNLTPVRTSVVSKVNPDSPQKQTYLDTAPTARSWIEPEPERANQIFTDVITRVTSGRNSVSEVIDNAESKLQVLLEEEQNE
jgi:ABC-type glycerol-3-phosphate transport system substrate-binding protein